MTNSENIPFSAKNRGKHHQIHSDFPSTARRGLLHVVYDLIEKGFVSNWGVVARELQRIGRLRPEVYDSISVTSMREARDSVEKTINELSWDKIYDFCERLHNHLSTEVGDFDLNGNYFVDTQRNEVQVYIEQEIQRLFLEEDLAFEFSEGQVRRRGRKHTVDVTTRAQVVLGDPVLKNARMHYEKAIQFFHNSKNPDFENAVKEAVCSVEASAKALFPEAKSSTLGDFVKWLLSSPDSLVPKALAKTIGSIYAYRSGGDGVGHGGSTGGAASQEVAEFVLAICASQIIYLVDVSNKKENDIPF